MRARAAWAVVLSATFAIAPRGARAEIRELATRVADQYRAAGARVSELPPRFLYEDETIAITPPNANGARCVTVAIVGARGLSFHAVEGRGEEEDEDSPAEVFSVAGTLELSSCDGHGLGTVRLRSDAGRGALETVVAFSNDPVPPLRVVLAERVGGTLPPSIDPGPVPPFPPPEKRAETAEWNAKHDGASVAPRAMAAAGPDGTGTVHVQLDRGCHRIELFSPELRAGKRRARLDLDAELRDKNGEALLARDRGESADARLELCLGERTETLLSFAGAAPASQIIVSRASWPLPPTLPEPWGADAKRRMAGAMRAHHFTPAEQPVALYEGVAGSTPIATEVEQGACYVAVVAATRGLPRGFVLRAAVGASEHADERGTADGAALVSFCAGDHDHVRLTVDARGSALAWGVALYRTNGAAWEQAP